jgi:microcystin-dependent protein
MDAYIGEIRTFSFNRMPRGWQQCSGQLLPINQNQALFSLLGTTYGGNGVSTFALPNLQGAAMLGQGSAPGGSYPMGQAAGTEGVTLTVNQLPMHNHMATIINALGSQPLGGGDDYLAQISVFTGNQQSTLYAVNGYTNAIGTGAVLAPATIGVNGGNAAHENRMPFLTMSVCICVSGYFPSRN